MWSSAARSPAAWLPQHRAFMEDMRARVTGIEFGATPCAPCGPNPFDGTAPGPLATGWAVLCWSFGGVAACSRLHEWRPSRRVLVPRQTPQRRRRASRAENALASRRNRARPPVFWAHRRASDPRSRKLHPARRGPTPDRLVALGPQCVKPRRELGLNGRRKLGEKRGLGRTTSHRASSRRHVEDRYGRTSVGERIISPHFEDDSPG